MERKGAKDAMRRHLGRPVTRRRACFELFVRLVVVLSLVGAMFVPRPERQRTYMPEAEVLDESPDSCVAAVGGNKVALMFLVRGGLHHEEAWRLWFRSAAGILPLPPSDAPPAANLCALSGGALDRARAACSMDAVAAAAGADAISQQHLFSVYVHLSADIDEAAVGPLWRPRLTAHRVVTKWGTHSLIEATRALLWEAFKDPSNARFVLISEADVPIWDPLTFFHELMAERRSRVDAWWHPDMNWGRWSWRMALSGARIRRSDWRKSAQWFSLLRSHAAVALADRAVFQAFEAHCRSAFDGDLGQWRYCYSDEHYLPTLLHMKGLQEETVPSPLGVTAADWSEGQPHPHEYVPEEVVPELFTRRLRNNTDCPSVAAQHAAVQGAARRNFVAIERALGRERAAFCGSDGATEGGASGAARVAGGGKLPSGCSLLARKFGGESAEAVLAVFRNCSSGLQLIGDAECAALGGEGAGAGRTARHTAAAAGPSRQQEERPDPVDP